MPRIASYLNRAGDIESTVTLRDDGDYVVRLIDVDAGEALPVAILFADERAARAYALRCVTGADDDDLPF